MSSVTLNGNAATAATLTVPGSGLWLAGVDLAEPVALSGAVTLQILDTTWSGFITSGGVVDGRARYRVIAGAGGWGAELAPKAYANDAGVSAAQLIRDAASEALELTPVALPTTTLGKHFSRPALPASFVLNLISPRAWYAQADGVVSFAPRAALPASSLPIASRDPAGGCVELIPTDSVAGLLPGTATEYGTAADVEFSLGEDGLRVRLYSSSALGRRAQAYARILEAVDPGHRYRGTWEYRVVTQAGERLNLQPVRSRALLPDLARVPVRAGVPGVKALHKPGSQVLVAFLDGDPSRPAVVGFDDPTQPGWHPIQLLLGDAPQLGVARQTDPVIAGPFAGTITLGSLRIKAGT